MLQRLVDDLHHLHVLRGGTKQPADHADSRAFQAIGLECGEIGGGNMPISISSRRIARIAADSGIEHDCQVRNTACHRTCYVLG
ncbi:hypothetical protein D9M71_704010 [compost metagenome]